MPAHPIPLVAGFDEVGRGCIAGPVVAAAVVFPAEGDWTGLDLADSKLLSPKQRRQLTAAIERCSVAWAIGRAEAPEIDRLNILHATLLAMRRAWEALPIKAHSALVDGNRYPKLPIPSRAVVGGDRTVPAISAASILAKVFRDREMTVLDSLFPDFGFAAHKGYPTKFHQAALQRLGPSPAHRRSFAPIKRLLIADSLFPLQ